MPSPALPVAPDSLLLRNRVLRLALGTGDFLHSHETIPMPCALRLNKNLTPIPSPKISYGA